MLRKLMKNFVDFFIVIIAMIALIPNECMSSIDDTNLRKNIAEQIARDHGIIDDLRTYTISELNDLDMRLNIISRIQRDHGMTVDWRDNSVSTLSQLEMRLNITKRIQRDHGITVDWKTNSISALNALEMRLNEDKRKQISTSNLEYSQSRTKNQNIFVEAQKRTEDAQNKEYNEMLNNAIRFLKDEQNTKPNTQNQNNKKTTYSKQDNWFLHLSSRVSSYIIAICAFGIFTIIFNNYKNIQKNTNDTKYRREFNNHKNSKKERENHENFTYDSNKEQKSEDSAQKEKSKKSNRKEKNNFQSEEQKNIYIKKRQYFASILGLNDNFTPNEIKKRYLDLVKQYHPDKVAHLGPKLKKLAEQEMIKINEAYEFFKMNGDIT